MSREIKFGAKATDKLKSGVDQLANAVKVTLGAKGRNVVIEKGKYAPPHITKDGVTVAREIELPDPVENMGATMVKEVAAKVVDEAGDGTTTATLLAQAIVQEGMKELKPYPWWKFKKNVTNPMDLKRGIDKGVLIVNDWLDQIKQDVTPARIKQVATISANNDESIGELIAQAMEKVSTDGVITVDEAKGNETTIDTVEGFQFVNGLLSPYFLTNEEKLIGEFEEPLIFLYGKKIAHTKEILPVIELGLATSRPLVIIAYDFEGEVIATLAQNRIQKGFRLAAIKAPSYGQLRKDYLEDLAIVTGGKVIKEEEKFDLTEFTEDMFGEADKVTSSEERTTIIGGRGDETEIEERIKTLKAQIENSKHEIDDIDTEKRISKLSGGVAVIYVGANTEVEMKERKDRIEDAKEATKAAVEEGIVAGGGVALLDCCKVLNNFKAVNKDQQKGIQVLSRAIKYPLIQIAENSGRQGTEVMRKVLDEGYPVGYDAKYDEYSDMFDAGIIDPKKVTRVALEAAASIASLILTTGSTINEIRPKK